MSGELVALANAVPWITRLPAGRDCQADAWGRTGAPGCKKRAWWQYDALPLAEDRINFDGLDRTRYLCMAHVFSQYGLYATLECFRYDDWREKRCISEN